MTDRERAIDLLNKKLPSWEAGRFEEAVAVVTEFINEVRGEVRKWAINHAFTRSESCNLCGFYWPKEGPEQHATECPADLAYKDPLTPPK